MHENILSSIQWVSTVLFYIFSGCQWRWLKHDGPSRSQTGSRRLISPALCYRAIFKYLRRICGIEKMKFNTLSSVFDILPFFRELLSLSIWEFSSALCGERCCCWFFSSAALSQEEHWPWNVLCAMNKTLFTLCTLPVVECKHRERVWNWKLVCFAPWILSLSFCYAAATCGL